jgi:hypothetical protein
MHFQINDLLLDNIKNAIQRDKEFEFTENLKWVDNNGKVYAELEKTIYVADRTHYLNKRNKLKK